MKPRVMIVEDERIVALNLKQHLSRLCYDVLFMASSGDEALERIERDPPDVILMDINIGGRMDGIETAMRIPEEHLIPIIYLTAYSGKATLDRARATRPYGFLLKPFSERELHATIEMALERRRADLAVRENLRRLETLLSENEQQRSQLQRSNADLEEFAYVASHDLKAPLRAITHLADWISEEVEPTASTETIDNLRLLRGRVIRLQALLDGLLAYSRIGRVDCPVEAVDVAEVVRDIVALISPPPGFVVACEGEMPVLLTQRPPIQIVLENLISNGLKHHDRSEGRVTISAHIANGVAELRVSDDGPGIEPRFHDRIFKIFQTLVARDESESSGLGLAIAKKRVENHGGRIWVESTPPARGTTIAFTWPRSHYERWTIADHAMPFLRTP